MTTTNWIGHCNTNQDPTLPILTKFKTQPLHWQQIPVNISTHNTPISIYPTNTPLWWQVSDIRYIHLVTHTWPQCLQNNKGTRFLPATKTHKYLVISTNTTTEQPCKNQGVRDSIPNQLYKIEGVYEKYLPSRRQDNYQILKVIMEIIQDYYQKHTNLPPNQYNPTPTKTGKGGKEEKENDYTYPPDILNPPKPTM